MSDKYEIHRWNSSEIPQAFDLQQILEREGYSVYEWTDAPQTFYPPHSHDKTQSHWIISGELEITVADCGTFILKAGDRNWLPAETVHSARVVGSAPVVYLIGEKNFAETVEK